MPVIYCIVCPITQNVVYVGKTDKPLKNRISTHYCSKTNSPISKWMQRLRKKGLKPLTYKLQHAPEYEFYSKSNTDNFTERFWIAIMIGFGYKLLNRKLHTNYNHIKQRVDK